MARLYVDGLAPDWRAVFPAPRERRCRRTPSATSGTGSRPTPRRTSPPSPPSRTTTSPASRWSRSATGWRRCPPRAGGTAHRGHPAHSAAVLEESGPEAVEPGVPFLEAGMNSVSAMALRNALSDATGVRTLSVAAIFHYATPAELAAHLCEELAHGEREEEPAEEVAADIESLSGLLRRAVASDQMMKGWRC
ncbi:acyl carrier protein [Streptomyces sp. M19]